MSEFYRVMMKRTEDNEPELWTNYYKLADADRAAKALVDSGIAVSAWVVIVTAEN
ncbi:MAG: hypothetical protein L0226_14665 [Acidobacteria bacterium]|nr:hypothetical protein [Acidobacteriota bacterium]